MLKERRMKRDMPKHRQGAPCIKKHLRISVLLTVQAVGYSDEIEIVFEGRYQQTDLPSYIGTLIPLPFSFP